MGGFSFFPSGQAEYLRLINRSLGPYNFDSLMLSSFSFAPAEYYSDLVPLGLNN